MFYYVLEPDLARQVCIERINDLSVEITYVSNSFLTAAFAIPVIQKVLNSKESTVKQQTSTLILAPSKELCRQVRLTLIAFIFHLM